MTTDDAEVQPESTASRERNEDLSFEDRWRLKGTITLDRTTIPISYFTTLLHHVRYCQPQVQYVSLTALPPLLC